MEICALAGECPGRLMHISADHVQLEIFDGDAPAAPGALGDIVATALHNTAMSLIRYRVGDLGRLADEPCPCGLPTCFARPTAASGTARKPLAATRAAATSRAPGNRTPCERSE